MTGHGLGEYIETLLTCFFTECESRFRFLETEHGFSYLSGLAYYGNGRQIIVPYKEGHLGDGPFWALTRYEKGDIAVEVAYGDADLVIEACVYPDRVHRLQFSEILQAARKNDGCLRESRWITHEDRIVKILSDIEILLRANRDLFMEPPARLVDRALLMRRKRMEKSVYETFKRNMRETSTMAARCFQNRDYRRVVELFRPYEQHLNTADTKKLNLALRHLLTD